MKKCKKSKKRMTIAQRTYVRDSTYVPPEEKMNRCELCEFFWRHTFKSDSGSCHAITSRENIIAIKHVHSLGVCDLFERLGKGGAS